MVGKMLVSSLIGFDDPGLASIPVFLDVKVSEISPLFRGNCVSLLQSHKKFSSVQEPFYLITGRKQTGKLWILRPSHPQRSILAATTFT